VSNGWLLLNSAVKRTAEPLTVGLGSKKSAAAINVDIDENLGLDIKRGNAEVSVNTPYVSPNHHR
jgi:hypothetical protein